MHADTHSHTQTHAHTHKQVHIVSRGAGGRGGAVSSSSLAAPGTLPWRLTEIDTVKYTAAATGYNRSNEIPLSFPPSLKVPAFTSTVAGLTPAHVDAPLITPNPPGRVHSLRSRRAERRGVS